MISRSHRFHGPNSLNFVYKNGTTIRGQAFAARVALNQRRDTYRVAVVISKKVNKSAVARNRLRRRLYAALRLLEGGISQPYDIVLSVYNDRLLQESPQSLERQLKKQLKEAGVLAPKK
jgi:ribonuclease P protein component